MDENTIGGNGSGIAGGTAKSEGERDGKSGKSGRTDFKSENGNKGFVEPSLARTTAGNANIAADTAADTGSTGSPGDTPGYVPPEQPTVKRGRGRPRKDGSTAAPKEARNLNVNGIEKILFSIHLIAAKGLDVPELLLDDKEAKELAEAIRKVNQHYAVMLTPKQEAMLELISVAGSIYMPRGIAFYLRKSAEAKPVHNIKPIDDTEPHIDPKTFDPTNIKIIN